MTTVQDIIVFGHSHTTALEHAASAPSQAFDFNYHFFQINHATFYSIFNVQCEPVRLHRQFLDKLTERVNTRPTVLVLLLAGNEHNIIGLARAAHEFSIVDAETDFGQIGATTQSISASMLRAVFAERLSGVIDLLDELKQALTWPMLMVESPPPIESDTHIMAHPGVFSDLLRQYGVNAPPLRQQMWAAQVAVMAAAAAERGIQYLPNPLDVVNERGYLKAQYWGDDPTHGNCRYGQRVLAQLQKYLQSGTEPERCAR